MLADPSGDERDDSQQEEAREKTGRSMAAQSALAMELPFTLVGATLVGGGLGYLLDRWLHTGPYLMLVVGALGFFGGVREVVRRLPTAGGSSGSGGSSGLGKPGNDKPRK